MSVRFFYDNSAFDAAALPTISSQSTDLPATNLQTSPRTRVWRTGNTLTTESVVADFTSAFTANACIAFFSTITNADSNFLIEANPTNSFGSPAFSQSLVLASILNKVGETYLFKHFGSSPPNDRFYRFRFDKSSSSQTRDVGRLFLGKSFDMVRAPRKDGINIQTVDGSNLFKAVGLNTYAELKDKYRVVQLTFPPVPQADIDNLNTMFALVGHSINLFLQIDQISPYDELLYVKLSGMYTKKLFWPLSPGGPFWDLSLSFEEQV